MSPTAFENNSLCKIWGGGVGQTECIMGHSKIENWNQLKKRITVFRAGIKYDLKEGVDQPNSFIV